jgi:hypothetical protein
MINNLAFFMKLKRRVCFEGEKTEKKKKTMCSCRLAAWKELLVACVYGEGKLKQHPA